MKTATIAFSLLAALALAGCDNEGQSVGNGPGNADGIGGRSDPPPAAIQEEPNPASTTDPAGAHTVPDGSTEDTAQQPQGVDAQVD